VAAQDVARENRLAAHAGHARHFADAIDARDPRWVLALRTQARLQGATLTPERRDELLAAGRHLGLRAFEANLVIAVVQDRARAGQPCDALGPTLALVGEERFSEAMPSAPVRGRRGANLAWWFLAGGTAAVLATVIARWLSNG
jgi:hypothetical protein